MAGICSPLSPSLLIWTTLVWPTCNEPLQHHLAIKHPSMEFMHPIEIYYITVTFWPLHRTHWHVAIVQLAPFYLHFLTGSQISPDMPSQPEPNQCTLDENGQLKDAKNIVFFHSPSNKYAIPLLPVDAPVDGGTGTGIDNGGMGCIQSFNSIINALCSSLSQQTLVKQELRLARNPCCRVPQQVGQPQ